MSPTKASSALAACVVAALLVGCGGSSDDPAPPEPAAQVPPAGPTPAQIAAEQEETGRQFDAYLQQLQAEQAAVYAEAVRQQSFDSARRGDTCGSADRDGLVTIVDQFASALASAAETRAYQLAATRRWRQSLFTASFAALRQAQLAALKPSRTVCSAAFQADLEAMRAGAINTLHDALAVRLAQAGLVG